MNVWDLNLDHQAVGCGRREYLVLRTGRKWVVLLAVGTFATIKLSRSQFEALPKVPVKYSKARLQRRLRENAQTYGASKARLQAALAAVRG